MAMSVPLHQLTHSSFPNSQVRFIFFFSVFVRFLSQILANVTLTFFFLMQKKQWKWCAKPSYSFSNNCQNKIRPIKASVETPPFPLFQNPKLEESPADGVMFLEFLIGMLKMLLHLSSA